MELLLQGKIGEAIRCALEEKDIDQTVALLSKLTAQQVNTNCSNIIRLCITQQLAADMSFNMPQEVTSVIVVLDNRCFIVFFIDRVLLSVFNGSRISSSR
jgi:hypothetical protein